MANEAKVKCYELDISYYLSKDEAVLRAPVKKEIRQKDMHSSLENFSNMLREHSTLASTSSISILLSKDKKKVQKKDHLRPSSID